MKKTSFILLFLTSLAQASTLDLYRSADQSISQLEELSDKPFRCEQQEVREEDLVQACARDLCGKASLNLKARQDQGKTIKGKIPPELAQDLAQVNELVEKRVQEKIQATKAELETFKQLKDKTITRDNGFELLQNLLGLSFTPKAEGQDEQATFTINAEYDPKFQSPEIVEIINDLKKQSLENLKQDPFALYKTGSVNFNHAFKNFQDHCQKINQTPINDEAVKASFKALLDFCQNPSVDKMGERKERELMQYWSKAIEFDKRVSKTAKKMFFSATLLAKTI